MVKLFILDENIEKIILEINDINLEILENSKDLLFKLKKQQYIELIGEIRHMRD